MNIFDAHISGSLSVSSSAEISGDLTVLGDIIGNISGNTTNAILAETASFAPMHTLTSSFGAFTSSYTTGSFTGFFIGDGNGLYDIPASGVTGLQLNQITDGSATASISQANGFRVNTNSEVTGTLKVTESSKFGNSLDDTHIFTGSVNVTGSIELKGGDFILNGTSYHSQTLPHHP